LGYPVPGGNKYRNLALLVGGVSKIETINYAHESHGTLNGKGCAGDVRQKLKSTDPTSRQRGRPTSTNPKLSTTKKSKREWGKLVAGPRWVPDTKMDWPTDRRSYYNFDFDFDLISIRPGSFIKTNLTNSLVLQAQHTKACICFFKYLLAKC
jgi:hypothetical protein